MDETKQTQDSSQDSKQTSGGTSEGSKGITSKQTKTYTEEEMSNILSAKGRDAKTLSDKAAALKAEQDAIDAEKVKIADWQKQRDEAELEEARRDPDKLAAWQKKQNEKTRDAEFAKREADLKKREAEQVRREAEHEAEIEAARETRLEMVVFELAAKYEVNPTDIKDGMKELGLTTAEQAETLAKRLSETKKQTTEQKEFATDSGVTSGHKQSSEGKSAREIYADNFRNKK